MGDRIESAGVERVNVQPGEIFLARTPMVLHTVLGSCVSVTFWSERLGAGALCHGVLPRCPPCATEDGLRYVDFSIRYLARQFDAMGALRQELQIKVFGGADVLATGRSCAGKPTVGSLNCQAALDVLELEGLRVFASDLGGNRGRTIRFDTATGDVFVHRLATVH